MRGFFGGGLDLVSDRVEGAMAFSPGEIKVIKRMAYGCRDDHDDFLKIPAAFPVIPDEQKKSIGDRPDGDDERSSTPATLQIRSLGAVRFRPMSSVLSAAASRSPIRPAAVNSSAQNCSGLRRVFRASLAERSPRQIT